LKLTIAYGVAYENGHHRFPQKGKAHTGHPANACSRTAPKKGNEQDMTEDRGDELFARFQETDEMQDWDAFVEAVKQALKDAPNAETVAVPAGFLRRVIEEIGATPLMFTAYRDRFNLLCDEMGMPEEKVPVPAPPEGASEGTF
jgi:hypothetical protein